MSKKLLVLVLLLSMLVVVSGCGGAENPDTAQTPDVSADVADVEKVTLMLDWTPNTNHTGFYVAQALGYYEEAGLQLEIIQPSEDGANMAVAAGQAQFGVGFQETLLPAITADAPLPITAIAAILAHNTSGLISMKDKNIASFKDLEGVSYASWDTPSELEIIRECMSAQGGDFAALKLVPNSGADALSLMQSGDIDVVWVYEGWDVQMAELAGLDYNFISFREAAPVLDFYTPVIITGNDFLTQSPETVKAFLTATARG
ncbi:MAG: ABC transporter substrate-binding protein, partial [Clostridiales bacterium]